MTCRASAPGWQRDAPQLAQEKGTHSSIPLLFQVYFVVPLTVFPKHLIPPHCIPRFFFCISLLPLGLWDVFKDTKIGKYRQTPTWYKFSNMSWKISFFFFFHAGCSSTGNHWCKLHILQHVAVHRDPAQTLAAAAAVRKLICSNQYKVMKQWRHQTLSLCSQTKCLLVLHAWVF